MSVEYEEMEPEVGYITCFKCGNQTIQNNSNMCIGCIKNTIDITEGIPKESMINFCRGCARFLHPPNQWIACELESKELMAVCIKRLKGLNNVKLVNAKFVWTEPHSRRIKVNLSIQREVLNQVLLNQEFLVEYVIHYETCEGCHRMAAKDTWNAVVQLRQKVQHKKTFLYLEQVLLKYNAHNKVLRMKPFEYGIDFFFSKRDHAVKLSNFFQSMLVCKVITSQQLISKDIRSNTQNFKYTFSVEIAPICKNDVVCLPLKTAKHLGHISQLAIVLNVSNVIRLMDPLTARVAELTNEKYWSSPFQPFATIKDMKSFTVMDCELLRDTGSYQGLVSQKHKVAEVWVQPTEDVGRTDVQIYAHTHLGYLLHPNDTVLGVDLKTSNVNDSNFELMKEQKIPDVILVKKVFANTKDRNRHRNWKLKRLNEDLDSNSSEAAKDMMEFKEDLEEDPLYRMHVNAYKDTTKPTPEEEPEEEYPQISLEEMLEDLTLEDEPMQD